MKAYIFPGQGAQFPGMGLDLYERFPEAQKRFEQANDILGFLITDVMFEGTPLHMALVGDGYLASVTRDAYTGNLNLDTNPTWLPFRIHNLLAEFDFPQYDPAAAAARTSN